MNNIDPTAPKPAVSGGAAPGAQVNVQDHSSIVRLEPDQPPGRCTRKALSFSDEIGRLHEAGYTLRAIRLALAKVGVHVSRSTVHREVTKARGKLASLPSTDIGRSHSGQVARPAGIPSTPRSQEAAAPSSPAPPTAPVAPDSPSFVGGPRGDDVAKAYMATQIANPFMRRKEHR